MLGAGSSQLVLLANDYWPSRGQRGKAFPDSSSLWGWLGVPMLRAEVLLRESFWPSPSLGWAVNCALVGWNPSVARVCVETLSRGFPYFRRPELASLEYKHRRSLSEPHSEVGANRAFSRNLKKSFSNFSSLFS